MKTYTFKDRFANKKGVATVNLSVILFKEKNAQIVFCPALDLSGSGNTIAQAEESFATTVKACLAYTINKGTLWADLGKLGWKIKGH